MLFTQMYKAKKRNKGRIVAYSSVHLNNNSSICKDYTHVRVIDVDHCKGLVHSTVIASLCQTTGRIVCYTCICMGKGNMIHDDTTILKLIHWVIINGCIELRVES